jgi:3-hydroxyacyl-[acyl-carrier-protein] dehydratase
VPRRPARDPDAPEASDTASPSTGFGYFDIAELLPHRYPFQLVDRVLEFVDGVRIVGLKNVSLGDPFFRGHFPDNPVMPGVLICEALAQTAALLAHRSTNGVSRDRGVVLAGLDGVRFRRPVLPGDQLRLEVELARSRPPFWRFRGVARVDGRLVAEAEIAAMEVPRGIRP